MPHLSLWPLNTMNNYASASWGRIFACMTAGVLTLSVHLSAENTLVPASPVKPASPAPTTPVAATPAKPVPFYRTYSYYGDRYRDPFIPLTGDVRSDQALQDRPPQIASLLLKGIVQDANGRIALLTSGANSYILRGGRLYDGRNRMVKKVAGIIKSDSVVIIGSDRTVRELKTKSSL